MGKTRGLFEENLNHLLKGSEYGKDILGWVNI